MARSGGVADVAGLQAPGYCHLVNALGPGAGASGRGVGRDPPDQARLGQLAEEQAALRRVATLVARGAAPEGVGPEYERKGPRSDPTRNRNSYSYGEPQSSAAGLSGCAWAVRAGW